ncbi:MAG: hypothetical protein AB4290_20370 [Spirulina sp.]
MVLFDDITELKIRGAIALPEIQFIPPNPLRSQTSHSSTIKIPSPDFQT